MPARQGAEEALADSNFAAAIEPQTCDIQNEKLEAIAVVGFSLRFPQDAVSPASFWSMLEQQRCATTEWPKDRVNLDAFYHPDSDRRDTTSVRGGHFLTEDLAGFDASFFSITAAEAMAMDPQQRILLETAYRALENAGIPIQKISGSKTGVYTGSMSNDYQITLMKDLEDLPRYTATGISTNMLANRVSWFFNLTGPSVNLDSACSSSLMALDLACNQLRSGDSETALVAGVNLVLALDLVLSLNNMGFLSPDSHCYSFDDRANGYSRGEGCGVIVLKRVSAAIRDGDTIRAVIRSTGSNQDGRTPGITQPNELSQSALIKETYEKAGLDFNTTRYFEAHGTGTAIGDPIEAKAIGSVFRQYRNSNDPLFIGSVKSNIGHLEGGSGIAGLIKTILVLEKGMIPPNANFRRINPRIDDRYLNIKIPTQLIPWPGTGLRRASVNSFGIGGSNSHAVLEDAYNYLRSRNLIGNHCTTMDPSEVIRLASLNGNGLTISGRRDMKPQGEEQKPSSPQVNGHQHSTLGVNGATANRPLPSTRTSHEKTVLLAPKLLVWSAADESALLRSVVMYHEHFLESSNIYFDNDKGLDALAFTLAERRSLLPWRTFAVIDPTSKVRDLLSLVSKPRSSSRYLGIGFVFTGQGAQYKGMGAELLSYSLFSDMIHKIEKIYKTLGCPWSLSEIMMNENSCDAIDRPEYAQPITTALQISLVELLRSFDILPSAVVGHSSGEIAAAYAVGALSLQSACKVAYHRGRFAGQLINDDRSPGAMLSVNLSEDKMIKYLHEQSSSERITIACVNSPQNVTISGSQAVIERISSHLQSSQIFAARLRTGVAYHSPWMQGVACEYRSSIEFLEKGTPPSQNIVMISSVTGQELQTSDELCSSEYWVQNLVQPVKFSAAITQMASHTSKASTRKMGVSQRNATYDLIEIGPHSTLRRPILETLATMTHKVGIRYHSVLSRSQPSITSILHLVGAMFTLGYPVAINQVNHVQHEHPSRRFVLTDLPEYPFDHSKKYWHESRLNKNLRLREHPRLDLLGTPVPDSNSLEGRWRKFFDAAETPWVEDHKVNGVALYPAAGMIIMALEGAKQMARPDREILGYRLKDVFFSHAISIDLDERRTEAQLYIRSKAGSAESHATSSDFRICVLQDGNWIETSRGTIQVQYGADNQTEIGPGQEQSWQSRAYGGSFGAHSQACNQKVGTERMYENLRLSGLEYGPAFQALDNLAWDGGNLAVGEIKTYISSDDEDQPVTQSHTVHPATLDGAAQLTLVALTKGGTAVIPTVIPTRIQDIWIASSGLGYPEPTILRAYSSSVFTGHRSTDCSMFAVDSMDNLKLSFSHMETTTVSSYGAASEQHAVRRQLCFNMDWKPDPTLLGPRQTLALCETGEQPLAEPSQFFQDLGLLMFYYMSKTLNEIRQTPFESFKPHIQRYVTWMKLQLEKYDRKLLPHSQAEWASRSQDHEYISHLSTTIQSSNDQGNLFVTVGRQLTDIVCGKVDSLELLFSNGLAEAHYREICDSIACCQQMATYLDLNSHKTPAQKVLEIGAGTGSMTSHVLASLSDSGDTEGSSLKFSCYDYTDITESFFEKAVEKFSFAKGRMHFKTLNIELDPLAQGFELASYDMIVANCVLHATRNLEVSLANTRKLLKPGGKLLLLEITEPEILRCGFAYGTLPGWWMGVEDYREFSPCITESKWNDLLLRNGFSGIDFALPDYQTGSCHEMSLMVSTAVGMEEEQPRLKEQIVVIIDPSSNIQVSLAKCICQRPGSLADSNFKVQSMQDMELTNHPIATSFIFLNEVEQALLFEIDQTSFRRLQEFLSTIRYGLWVTGSDPDSPLAPKLEMITGLSRVVRSERSSMRFITLACQSHSKDLELCAENIVKVLHQTREGPLESCETEVLEIDGVIHIPRIDEAVPLNVELQAKTTLQPKIREFQSGPPLSLSIVTPGLMDSAQFTEDETYQTDLLPDEIEIKVESVGVNFRDLLVVLGKTNADTIGCECAGTVTRVGSDRAEFLPGDRVCAAIVGCAKTFARCNFQQAVKIPDSLTYAEAAAIPITGVTAYYALVECARLQKGETILIHLGSGGTGQMAVQVAQMIGAEVFVTVGFPEKRQLLMDLYKIPEDHIFYSRDTSFAADVMRMTNGRGVDVLLNSLSGESLVASWESIAPFGRFVEIGKADIHANSKLAMGRFAKNVSFSALAVDYMINERPALIRKSLSAVLEMLQHGTLKIASPLHEYPISKMEDAFRFMQSGKNTGKIVLSMGATDLVPTLLRTKSTSSFDPNATYVIAGGLGGLGRSAARWMVSRGARNLILLSRSGPKSQAASDLVRDLQDLGVCVATPKCDVASTDSLSDALSSSEMPPIKGCIQGSMVLRDVLYENMSIEDWNVAIHAKVQGSWNLHKLLPRDLDFFIMLSSAAGIIGSTGQANYAAGNTYQDALARYRARAGEKAVALDLGWMTEVGIIAENDAIAKGKEAAADMAGISEAEFHALLDRYCDPTRAASSTSAVLNAQTMVGLVTPAQFRAKGIEPPDWIKTPMFARLGQLQLDGDSTSPGASTDESVTDFLAGFVSAASQADASEVVMAGLAYKLGKAIAVAPSDVDTTKPLHAYGVDSLLAVELRNWFAKVFKADIAVFDIMGKGNIAAIAAAVAEKSTLRSADKV